jgi:hypothetical protein
VRSLCCYTVHDPAADGKSYLHSAKRDALRAVREHVPGVELADVGGNDFAYWREIRARWQGAEDLLVVEHDIEPGPGMAAALEYCPEPWCLYSYEAFGCKLLDRSLGFTRFSAGLQRAVNLDLAEERWAHCGACHGRGCWWHLDIILADILEAAGFSRHVHGTVRHLHDYGAPGTLPLMDGIMSVFSWEAGQQPVQFHVPFAPGAEPPVFSSPEDLGGLSCGVTSTGLGAWPSRRSPS